MFVVSAMLMLQESLKDAPLIKQKPILTFASPGFMRLIDHLRSLKEDQTVDAQFCDEHRLYGLGTYSSDRNYEIERDEGNRTFDYRLLESMIGYGSQSKHLVSFNEV